MINEEIVRHMTETLTRCQAECTQLVLRVRELEAHNARLIIERDCANASHVIRLGPGQSGDCDCGLISRRAQQWRESHPIG